MNIKTNVKNISEISVEEDFNKNIFMVFFVSTYGEGGPSDDAIEFNRLIEKKTLFENLENKKLHYAIFGLGSKKYEYFNQMAKKIDKFFAKNHLTQICEVGLGDDSNNINKDFEEWRTIFWKKSFEFYTSKKEEIKSLSLSLNLNSLFKKNEKEFFIFSSSENKQTINNENYKSYKFNVCSEDYDYSFRRFSEAVYCEIKEIKELRKETINGSTLLIKYKSNLNYQVGDNIGVYPVNNEYNVNEIIKNLNFDANEKFEVRKNNGEILKKKIDFPDCMTVKEIINNYIDLSAHVK